MRQMMEACLSGVRLYLVGNEKSLNILWQCHDQIRTFKKSCCWHVEEGLNGRC